MAVAKTGTGAVRTRRRAAARKVPGWVSALASALAAGVVAASAAGCSSSPNSVPAAHGTAAGPASPGLSGTVTVFAAASLNHGFTELGKRFEAAHPGVTVRF